MFVTFPLFKRELTLVSPEPPAQVVARLRKGLPKDDSIWGWIVDSFTIDASRLPLWIGEVEDETFRLKRTNRVSAIRWRVSVTLHGRLDATPDGATRVRVEIHPGHAGFLVLPLLFVALISLPLLDLAVLRRTPDLEPDFVQNMLITIAGATTLLLVPALLSAWLSVESAERALRRGLGLTPRRTPPARHAA